MSDDETEEELKPMKFKIRDEKFKFQPEVPGVLGMRSAAMIGADHSDDQVIGQMNGLIMQTFDVLIMPEDKQRFDKFLLTAKPAIDAVELMGVYTELMEKYVANFPGEESDSSPPSSKKKKRSSTGGSSDNQDDD